MALIRGDSWSFYSIAQVRRRFGDAACRSRGVCHARVSEEAAWFGGCKVWGSMQSRSRVCLQGLRPKGVVYCLGRRVSSFVLEVACCGLSPRNEEYSQQSSTLALICSWAGRWKPPFAVD